MSPSEGCKVIVKAALEKDGESGVFITADANAKVKGYWEW
jgi:hypothetical protein